ncbi:decarboxylase [Paracoccus sp. S-4012]|uniref:malonyl-CoA decarboxylase domain-containing protein n=1 Tax=Paracoccus sp. S-4012 TaxID=2665648 RepID=UPI0012AF7126|nr:malonyl-CoA decarboxylase [Paracoccus sp. S-4012]MRX50143.1 decarboxylase [Paracoccus sp. S-4012]
MIRPEIRPARLYDRLSSLVDSSAWLLRRPGPAPVADLSALMAELPRTRSETRALALAAQVLEGYGRLDAGGRRDFFRALRDGFDPDRATLEAAARAWLEDPTPATLEALSRVSEPPRQELLRRLNMAPGGTARLVTMRAHLLDAIRAGEDLGRVDADLRHLLRSWFNRGFLTLEHIDWDSSARLLEKLIAYEAVHEIHGWDDLRRRVLPPDRRCYAYMHPAMPDEPLIFVEVALMRGLPDSIQAITAEKRAPLDPATADTAVFYSISNCQTGLAGISFGNLLIKNVVAELRHELPQLGSFVTLSPMPGFSGWLDERAAAGEAAAQAILGGDDTDLLAQATRYLLCARDERGRPRDPVARFHLGNGAEAHRVVAGADRSPRGLRQARGVMVNYLYDSARIDARHDAFTETGAIAAPKKLHDLARRAEAAAKETP